jgi:hypothetical protein
VWCKECTNKATYKARKERLATHHHRTHDEHIKKALAYRSLQEARA